MELLKESQRRSDKIFDDIIKYQDEMKNLMMRMAALNIQTVNFKDIIELIKEGIIILAKIREQWSKLIQFFTMVSVRAEVALNQTLNPFIRMSENADQAISEGALSASDRQLFKEILQKQAADIHKVAFFLYTLSSTYVDVSSRFLMDRLAGLARMLVTDNDQQKQVLMQQLMQESDEAQSEIKRLSQSKRLAYNRLVQKRIDEVNTYVDSLGGPTEEDKNAVKKGITVGKNIEKQPSNPFDIDV